ncbi:hypothetical protein IQ247_17060 [Plectonema cf. radiosum LEGE 06105]|uniref:Glutathione S-transferase n=1 Tax=Plectonema cf. radiosum LEGE 06105 TaxID=945769 RepID=A0A8J7FDH5_9CYAN|nr:hypothetical protein [Plectonema radiosum]MBE9214358.1 hypothetical protein [Plectonema cf. radiosum LEGE 06105]
MKRQKAQKAVLLVFLTVIISILGEIFLYHKTPVIALPPKVDIPEEILRTEIIIEARSPIDGKPLSPAEYAQLQAELKTRPYPPQLSPKVRDTVFLLRLRKILKTIFPFINF